MAHLQALHMADVKPVRGHRAEHIRLGVRILFLGDCDSGVRLRPASTMLDVDVAQADVFDRVVRNAADDRPKTRSGIRANDIADRDSPQLSYGRVLRSAHAAAE